MYIKKIEISLKALQNAFGGVDLVRVELPCERNTHGYLLQKHDGTWTFEPAGGFSLWAPGFFHRFFGEFPETNGTAVRGTTINY